jgi:TM2 domain-containing membrane protein YozV
MASSRLQRCHPRAYHYYPVDGSRSRLHDPVLRDEPSARGTPSMPVPASRGLAMAMSTLVPGAGQVYAGRPWDGVYSFLQTALPAGFSVMNYRREGPRSVRGGTHALLAVGFYVGGIFGAGEAAATRRVGTGCVEVIHGPQAGDSPRSGEGLLGSQKAVAEARLGQWEESERTLTSHFENHPDAGALDALRFIHDRNVRSERRAKTARILSTIVPGAGQLYAGKPGAAATSLVVNGLLGYYVVRTAQTDSWGELTLFALPTFWRYYRGGAAAAGRLASVRDDRSNLEDLQRRIGP